MNAAGLTVGEALMWLAVFVGVLALIIRVVVWRGRRRGRKGIALDIALTLSAWWLLGVTFFAVMQTIQLVTAPWTAVTSSDAYADWGSDSTCAGMSPETGPALDCAGIDSMRFTLVGISLGAKLLLLGGQLLTSVLLALPAALLAVIARNALRGRPFAPAVARWLYLGAGVVLVAGIGAAILTSLGTHTALHEVLPAEGVQAPSIVRFAIDPLILGGAVVAAALGAVFQHGARLQKETEGLV